MVKCSFNDNECSGSKTAFFDKFPDSDCKCDIFCADGCADGSRQKGNYADPGFTNDRYIPFCGYIVIVFAYLDGTKDRIRFL